MFIFESNGNSVTWRPNIKKHGSGDNSWRKHFEELQRQVENRLGVSLDDTALTYNPSSVGGIIANDIQEQLNVETIKTYWNLLNTDNKVQSMNFIVGDLPNKKTILISSLIHQQGKSNTVCFAEDEDDDEENYQKLLKYVKSIYERAPAQAQAQNKEDEEAEDDDDYIDYDDVPYYLFKVERDTYKQIIKDNGIDYGKYKYHLFKEKYSLDEEVDDPDVLNEGYDTDDTTDGKECVLFVESKNYLSFEFGEQIFEWVPSTAADNLQNVKWEKEYPNMIKEIREYFHFNEKEKLLFINEETELMNEFDAFGGTIWAEMIEDKSRDKPCHSIKILISLVPTNFNVCFVFFVMLYLSLFATFVCCSCCCVADMCGWYFI